MKNLHKNGLNLKIIMRFSPEFFFLMFLQKAGN